MTMEAIGPDEFIEQIRNYGRAVADAVRTSHNETEAGEALAAEQRAGEMLEAIELRIRTRSAEMREAGEILRMAYRHQTDAARIIESARRLVAGEPQLAWTAAHDAVRESIARSVSVPAELLQAGQTTRVESDCCGRTVFYDPDFESRGFRCSSCGRGMSREFCSRFATRAGSFPQDLAAAVALERLTMQERPKS